MKSRIKVSILTVTLLFRLISVGETSFKSFYPFDKGVCFNPIELTKNASDSEHITKLRDDFLKWKFGMFIHFNMATCNEREWANGYEDPASFSPEKLDCNQWADVAQKAGMKYAVLTVKHTGGWCLWDSKFTTSHDVSAFKNYKKGKGDIVREFVDAFRKRGIKVGLYYCFPGDYSGKHGNILPEGKPMLHGLPPEAKGDYAGFIKNQLSELMTNYGEIDLIWIDQFANKYTYSSWPEIREHIKSYQPNCLVLGNNSNDFNESDIWGFEYPYFKDRNPAKALPQEGNTAPSEVCDKIGPGWFWSTKENNRNLKSAEEMAEMLILSNNRSANYLLNVAPDNTGLIPEHSVERLKQFRILMDAFEQKSDKAEFVNDICLPGKLYMLEGVQNYIFVQPLIKRWRPYNDVVRFSGTADYSRRLEKVASIVQPKDSSIVTLNLVNTDEFVTVRSLSAEILTGKPGVGNRIVKVSVIGDSFTQGSFFKSALLENNYVPGIKMIGLCQVKDHPGQFHEGRGGWTLSRYFAVSKDRTRHYNGFWQPEGNYRYWGSTAYWKLVKEVSISPDPQEWQFAEHYSTQYFTDISSGFDRQGVKLDPQGNDLMYDNAIESFVLFDGKKWNPFKYEDFKWSFNYSKYLEMWKLESPEILAEFLGLNDFRNAGLPGNLNFKQWNEQMEQMITSYHSAVPNGKFVLMIPSSSCGILDNKSGDFTLLQNANMWELRKNIIEQFDKRTDENIYVVDAGIAIDNYYGTRFLNDSTYTLPYAGFEGDGSIKVQTGNPHPYPNYPNMGISLAAFIQHFRMK